MRLLTEADKELDRRKAELDTLSLQRDQQVQRFDAEYDDALRLVQAAFLILFRRRAGREPAVLPSAAA